MERRTASTLLWATCCLLVVAQDDNLTTQMTWTIETTSNTMQEDVCNFTWDARRSNTTLLVTWGGDLNLNDTVTVLATKLCDPDPQCKVISESRNFSEGSLELELERNALYNVEATFGDCYTVNDSSRTIPFPVGAPNLTAIKTDTTINLTWDPFLDYVPEDHHLLYVIGVDANGTDGKTNITNYLVTGLHPYSKYTFRVNAVFDGIEQEDWDLQLTEWTEIGVPYAPTALTATHVGNTSVGLTWDAPENSTGPILQYWIRWEDSGGRPQTNDTVSNGTSHEVLELLPYQRYTFMVQAETVAGRGNWSDGLEEQTKVGVPHAPTALNAALVGNTTIGLTWEAPGISTGPVLRYRIQWEDFGGRRNENDTDNNGTSYEVVELVPYQRYTFRVQAETDAGHGNWSEDLEEMTEVGVPYAPTALNATLVGNTSVGLTWEAPENSTGPILQYWIRWEVSGGRSQENYTSNNDTFYEVGGLNSYQRYTFMVQAETDAGRGDWSDGLEEQTKVGVPHAPTALNSTVVGNTTVELTWEAPGISTGPVLQYWIQWEDPGGVRNDRNTSNNDTYYEVEGLLPFRLYTFRVQAETDAGRGTWSDKLEVETEVGVPHAPTALNSTLVENTTVGLTWEAPGISTGPIFQYWIRWEDSEGRPQENDTGSNDTSYKVVELIPYQRYTFMVQAETVAGRGDWSDILEEKTKEGVPHAPVGLDCASKSNTSVTLRWKAPSTFTGPIKRYRVRWRSGNGPDEKDTPNATTSYRVDGLTSYQNYTFEVLGITAAGTGSWSEEITVQTGIGVPSVPTNFLIDHKTNVSLQVSWTAPESVPAPWVRYIVAWRKEEEPEEEPKEDVVLENGANRHEILDLLPYTNFTVWVYAVTGVGRGPPTDPQTARTDVGVPKQAVILAVALDVERRRTAAVSWRTEGPFPGPTKVSLQAWKDPDECSGRVSAVADAEEKDELVAANWTSYARTAVRGLTPFGRYKFVVLLRTDAADGVESEKSEVVQMPQEAPGPPRDVVAECGWSPTEARLSWVPPSSPNGRIVSYQIRYNIVGQKAHTSLTLMAEDTCSDQKRVISGMRPERNYSITVTAVVDGVSEKGTPARAGGICQLPPGIPYLGNTSHLLAISSAPHHVTLEWTGDTFSEYMGEIVRYAVLVGRTDALGASESGIEEMDSPSWSNFSSGASDFYQATPTGWNPFGTGPDPLDCLMSTIEDEDVNRTLLLCTIGSQWPCPNNETYCNGPLEPDTSYQLKIRGFTRKGYNETQLLHTRTGSLPGKGVGGAVAGAVVTLLLIGALAGGCYVMKKRGALDPMLESVWSKVWPAKEGSCGTGNTGQEMQRYQNSRPILTKLFSEHVDRMLSDSHLEFSQEFEDLKSSSPLLPCTIADSEENRSKNRWMNIFPFDHTRVKLLPLCDDPGSDFINASYIPGPSSLREYIASQGPLPNTLDDFWRMVWEQSVSTIVMLTQCTERGKRKCEQYWPEPGESRYFGDLAVATVSESMLPTYVIRVIRLQLGSYDRQVKQMHFMHWPDFGCPARPEDLIEFVRAVRDHLPRRVPGPILVHCSAGVGRTGTFIAVDRLCRQLRGAVHPGEDEVDVFGMVLQLRHHRTNMVQTEDQYIYIHLCVRQLIEARDHPQIAVENIYSNIDEVNTSF